MADRLRTWVIGASLAVAGCAATVAPEGDVFDDGGPDDGVGDLPPGEDADPDEGGGGDGDCEAPRIRCGADCVDPATDPSHCGGCGIVCSAPWTHTEAACAGSICVVRCAPGWVDMDGEPGCETACPGGGPETCNGADDDCDGSTDEEFPCASGAEVDCTTACLTRGRGTCGADCLPPADAACRPPLEACNGLDDDCDGVTDDDLPCAPGDPVACTTPCGSAGTGSCGPACEIPSGSACRPPPEACNGLDDDCDGSADEDFACAQGAAVSCTTACGTAGTGICTVGCTRPTGSACTPPPEACNGLDDDCDGATDEELPCSPGATLACTTVCGTAGTGRCSAACEPPAGPTCTPPAEVCNARDDDCDTVPDDGLPCAQGAATACTTACGSAGTGTCSASCALPTGAACAPPAETCNGTDDDCDGAPDDGFPCVQGRSVACTTACGSAGTGTCTASCALPTGAACPAPAEVCNNADDDCDTLRDEGLAGCPTCPRACSGRACGDDGCGGVCGTCTPPATCNAAGACVTAPTFPSNACTTGSQSRSGCGNARVVSRTAAAATFAVTDSTCSASDRHDDACPSFDVGFDHTYAVFMKNGERLAMELSAGTIRCTSGEEWHSYLKVKTNSATDAAGATSCPTFVGCWAGPNWGSSISYARTHTATADGWVFVIVDGGATAYDEHRGHYTLRLTLSSCVTAGCACA